MWLKVCGITREEDGRLAASLGAEAIGFVFWPGSRRFIEPGAAREIAVALPAVVRRVGVFVNETVGRIEATVHHVGLDLVQLHGDEAPEFCERMPVRVIKAFPVGAQFSTAALAAYPWRVTVLLDAEDRAARGGTGRSIDYLVAREVAGTRPTILAGGLTPENVGDAIRAVRPRGVDVSSGVESSPGVKDPDRLRRFVEAVRSAEVAGA